MFASVCKTAFVSFGMHIKLEKCASVRTCAPLSHPQPTLTLTLPPGSVHAKDLQWTTFVGYRLW